LTGFVRTRDENRRALSTIVARVRPRTYKGVTDLLLLYLIRLGAVCPSKKLARMTEDAGRAERRAWGKNFPVHPPPNAQTDDCLASIENFLCVRSPKETRGPLRTERSPFVRIVSSGELVSRLESRSLSELTRQITPPTRNGHAPPPTASRKVCQPVNRMQCLGRVSFPALVKLSRTIHSW